MNFIVKHTTSFVFVLATCCLFVFSSCSDDKTVLNLFLDKQEVSAEENSQFLKIETDPGVAWTATVTQGADWCWVSPTAGVGSLFAIVKVGENNTTDSRVAVISVSAGNTVQTVDIIQQKQAIISITVSKSEVASAANTLPIQVKTKEAWKAVVTDGADFCMVSPTSGAGNATITAAFSLNQGPLRTAIISVRTATDTVNVSIRQVAAGQVPGGNRPEQVVPKRIELPEVKNKRWYIQHNYYAMEYDTLQKHSVWVAYVLNSSYLQKRTTRSDAWAQDPEIPFEFSSQRSDFSGYDRGHMLPSADRLFSVAANTETFYYSNMSPQVGAFNQNIWEHLESKVRTWAASCDTLYIVTGGAINSGIEVKGHSSGGVTIPKYYFKALVKRKGNAFNGIAFWLENRAYSPDNITYEYSMTIRELERKTGINFFPNLGDKQDAVETIVNQSEWPL